MDVKWFLKKFSSSCGCSIRHLSVSVTMLFMVLIHSSPYVTRYSIRARTCIWLCKAQGMPMRKHGVEIMCWSGKSTGQTGLTKGAEQWQLLRHTILQTGELEATRESIKAKDGNTQKQWERETERERMCLFSLAILGIIYFIISLQICSSCVMGMY